MRKRTKPKFSQPYLSGWKARNEISLPMWVYILSFAANAASPTVLITHSVRNRHAHYGSSCTTTADDEDVDKVNTANTAGGGASRDAVIPAVTFRYVIGHASTTPPYARRKSMTSPQKKCEPRSRCRRPLAEQTRRSGAFPTPLATWQSLQPAAHFIQTSQEYDFR
ncbi:hypothetical protein HPB50_015826 [Hyalomma asiaticum]|uniref:Uncharacterized protein n=1 Tax=Hyalomma asiaticum TaxID=266040 RepID=A0ACB7SN65_HYAAI|nr:hypothetical protein HPB50_015826 [Hyalomma asiaticum]